MSFLLNSAARVIAMRRREARFLADALRTETVGGVLLLGAAFVAILWANSPWADAYLRVRDLKLGLPVGPTLSVGHWAADGLLALLFLVAGIELKREFVDGDLSDRAKAIVPVTAALAGVLLPAGLYVATVTLLGGGSDALAGWAVPTATDIAFALGVLAVVGSHLPVALRAFLLTLAVVDDLVAITVIAVFYSTDVRLGPLLAALVPIAIFSWLLRRRITHPLLLAGPALLAWGLVQASGVHATVAGVLLGLSVPVQRHLDDNGNIDTTGDPDRVGGSSTVAESVEHALRPWSAGVAVPVFAFFAAGVHVVDGGLHTALADPVAMGVVVALVVGKTLGVFGGTWAVTRFTRAELDEGLTWSDLLGVSALSGVGFTVSLLIGELAFGSGSARDDHVKLAVLAGSLLAAALATVILRRRDRHYRALAPSAWP